MSKVLIKDFQVCVDWQTLVITRVYKKESIALEPLEK